MPVKHTCYLILEGKEIRDRTQFYDALETLLDRPEVFGRNLDGLHDVLTDLLPARRIHLTVRDFPALEESLGQYALRFRGMLDDLAEEDERFTVTFD